MKLVINTDNIYYKIFPLCPTSEILRENLLFQDGGVIASDKCWCPPPIHDCPVT